MSSIEIVAGFQCRRQFFQIFSDEETYFHIKLDTELEMDLDEETGVCRYVVDSFQFMPYLKTSFYLNPVTKFHFLVLHGFLHGSGKGLERVIGM